MGDATAAGANKAPKGPKDPDYFDISVGDHAFRLKTLADALWIMEELASEGCLSSLSDNDVLQAFAMAVGLHADALLKRLGAEAEKA